MSHPDRETRWNREKRRLERRYDGAWVPVPSTGTAAGGGGSITIRKNTGANVGTQPRLNLIEGTNVTLTVTDDPGSSEVDITIASSGGGGGGGTTGTAVVDFGAFPGSSYASVAVTGQAGIVAGSIVRAGIRPTASADHSADEHMIESLRVVAGDIIAGTGFTIHVLDAEPTYERIVEQHAGYTWAFASATTVGTRTAQAGRITDRGGKLRRIHGQYNLWWHWS